MRIRFEQRASRMLLSALAYFNETGKGFSRINKRYNPR